MMRAHRISVMLLTLFLSMIKIAFGQHSTWKAVAEEVVIVPVGPFGEHLSDCKLSQFLTGNDKGRPVDRRYRFTGLIGKDVPFGTYVISVRCGVPREVKSMVEGVSSTLEVSHTKELLVISSHRWLGDHAPGGGPKLQVSVRRPSGDLDPMWIKMVGLYLNKLFVAGVDERSSKAEIVDAMPGDYMLLVLVPGKLVCQKAMRVLDPMGSIIFDASQGCEVVDTKGVKELTGHLK